MMNAENEKSAPTLAAEDGPELHVILAELREGMTRIEQLTRRILDDETQA